MAIADSFLAGFATRGLGTFAVAHATLSTLVGTGYTVINFDTVDAGAGVTTGAAWHYTVPTSGTYAVTASCAFYAGQYLTSTLNKNGIAVLNSGASVAGGFTAVGGTVVCTAGDTLDFRVLSSAAQNSAAGFPVGCTITIVRVA